MKPQIDCLLEARMAAWADLDRAAFLSGPNMVAGARAWAEFEGQRPHLLEWIEVRREVLTDRITDLAARRAAWQAHGSDLLLSATLWVLARDAWDLLLYGEGDLVTRLVQSSRAGGGLRPVDEVEAGALVHEVLEALEASRRSAIWEPGAASRGGSPFELQNIHAHVRRSLEFRLRDRQNEARRRPVEPPPPVDPPADRDARQRVALQIARLAWLWSATAARQSPQGEARWEAVVSCLADPEGTVEHRLEQARSKIRMDATVRGAVVFELGWRATRWADTVPARLCDPDARIEGDPARVAALLEGGVVDFEALLQSGLTTALSTATAELEDPAPKSCLGAILIAHNQYFNNRVPRRGAELPSYAETARLLGARCRFTWPGPPTDPEDDPGGRRPEGESGHRPPSVSRRSALDRARAWRLVQRLIEIGERALEEDPDFEEVLHELNPPAGKVVELPPPTPLPAAPQPRGATWTRGPLLLLAALLLLGVGVGLWSRQSEPTTGLLASQTSPWIGRPSIRIGDQILPWPAEGALTLPADGAARVDIGVDRNGATGPMRALAWWQQRGRLVLVYDATVPEAERFDPAPRVRPFPQGEGTLFALVAREVPEEVLTATSADLLAEYRRAHPDSWFQSVQVLRP